jgi:hypothetical protein
MLGPNNSKQGFMLEEDAKLFKSCKSLTKILFSTWMIL